MMQDIAKFALDLQGPGGLLTDPEVAEGSARFQAMLLRSPAVRIEGGTDQILRNIIAERVLGLPEDMRADKGIPFNEIPGGGGH
jgi:acyl-CoA dehydrogenase